jgi:hypothetical protein
MRERFSSRPGFWRCVFGLLVVSHAWPVPAQSLYRVELMVFAYPAGGASEQWEATPELAYPERARALSDPRNQDDMTPRAGNTGELPSPSASSATPEPDLQPQPAAFALLPARAREFGNRTAAMQASGRYRILFHEVWVQPMPTQSAAIPIVLDRSGEGGAWPELQGTITLYQAGGVVAETNLWLNTMGEYLPGTWRMPPPPRGPEPGRYAQSGAALAAQDVAGQAGEARVDGVGEYPYRHAVHLQQSRQIRSHQVAYIDHPMLGVAVKISPVEEPGSAPAGAAEIPPSSSPTP